MYRKNVAGQHLPFVLVSAATGAALAGASVTARRSLDGAAQASATGSVTELGNGQYNLALSQADTNGNNIGVLLTATNAIPVHFSIVTTAADPTNASTFGLSGLATAAAQTTLQTSMDDIPTNAELATSQAAADDATLAAIAALNNLSAAQVNAEMLDALNVDTYAEITSIPAAVNSLAVMIRAIYATALNHMEETGTGTSGTLTLKNRANSATIGTAPTTDAAGTATRGSFS